jgi:hypothetical protein
VSENRSTERSAYPKLRWGSLYNGLRENDLRVLQPKIVRKMYGLIKEESWKNKNK